MYCYSLISQIWLCMKWTNYQPSIFHKSASPSQLALPHFFLPASKNLHIPSLFKSIPETVLWCLNVFPPQMLPKMFAGVVVLWLLTGSGWALVDTLQALNRAWRALDAWLGFCQSWRRKSLRNTFLKSGMDCIPLSGWEWRWYSTMLNILLPL